MGFGFEKDDSEILLLIAPVMCPSCEKTLKESNTGNRVCENGFPPCCYMYWNRKEQKHYWVEGYGPQDVYDDKKKVWLKKEPTETIQ